MASPSRQDIHLWCWTGGRDDEHHQEHHKDDRAGTGGQRGVRPTHQEFRAALGYACGFVESPDSWKVMREAVEYAQKQGWRLKMNFGPVGYTAQVYPPGHGGFTALYEPTLPEAVIRAVTSAIKTLGGCPACKEASHE